MSTLINTEAFVVLGASDPEMNRIEQTLKREGIRYGYAMAEGRDGEYLRVHPGNAYKGEAVQNVSGGPAPFDTLVRVECAIKGLDAMFGAVVVCDHHNEGDAGYGCGPDKFWEGSSIGQVYNLFVIEPQESDLLTAASDHCPSHAYKGMCPGIDVESLMTHRAANTAAFRKLSIEKVIAGVTSDSKLLSSGELQEVQFADQTVVVTESPLNYGPEASLRTGIAIISVVRDRDGRQKEVLLGGTPNAIKAFMADRGDQNREVYGCPVRGYAGAYLA